MPLLNFQPLTSMSISHSSEMKTSKGFNSNGAIHFASRCRAVTLSVCDILSAQKGTTASRVWHGNCDSVVTELLEN
jgi:hypothetical protein